MIVVRELRGGWILLGEVAKYVPLSPARFTAVNVTGVDSDVLVLSVHGAPGEIVDVVLKQPTKETLALVSMRVGASGVATVRVQRDSAY